MRKLGFVAVFAAAVCLQVVPSFAGTAEPGDFSDNYSTIAAVVPTAPVEANQKFRVTFTLRAKRSNRHIGGVVVSTTVPPLPGHYHAWDSRVRIVGGTCSHAALSCSRTFKLKRVRPGQTRTITATFIAPPTSLSSSLSFYAATTYFGRPRPGGRRTGGMWTVAYDKPQS